MRIKQWFRSLLYRTEDLATQRRGADIDIVDQLDKSWSGRGRNGPRYYCPPSREWSTRGPRPRALGDAHDTSRSGRADATPGPRKDPSNSEPFAIQIAHDAAETKRDSASSLHADQTPKQPLPQVRSSLPVPVQKGRTGQSTYVIKDINNAQKTDPSESFRANNATKGTLSSGSGDGKNVNGRQAKISSSRRGQQRPALKQGALAEALSREASVRQGKSYTEGALSDSLSGVGSWAHRAVIHKTVVETRQAVLPGDKKGGVDPVELATMLQALKAADGEEHVVGEGDSSQESRPEGTPGMNQTSNEGASLSVGNKSDGKQRDGEEVGERKTVRPADDAVSTCHRRGNPGDSSGDGNGLSSSPEWNARFVRRWKQVKKSARLQALGFRNIWKLSSSAGHERHPPELLTNDMPYRDPRDALSVSSAELQQCTMSMTSSERHIDRDPSLATMLLGEVAEIC